MLVAGLVLGCATEPDRSRSPGRRGTDSGATAANPDAEGHASDAGSAVVDSGVAPPPPDSGTSNPPPPDSGTSNPPPGGAASLRITEINAASRADLIELVAVQGGALDGIALNERTNSGFRFTFPNGYTVRRGDVIVLHLNGACTDDVNDKTSCGGTAPLSTGAWDFSMRGSLSYSGKVFVLIADDGAMMDGVPFVESGGAVPSSYATAVRQLQAEGLWDATPCVDDQTTGFPRD